MNLFSMKTARKQGGKAARAPVDGKEGIGSGEKSRKRIRGKLFKATDDGIMVQRDENSPPNSAEAFWPQSQEKSIKYMDTANKLLLQDLHSAKMLSPSGKMKLQLFPVDDNTRVGLEKDGFHPYLELSLSSRKRISSVLKHFNSKWGSSSIAQGDPMLFPYGRGEHLASNKWTLKENISVGDVYATIGSPPNFRLRYGWFSNTKAELHEPQSVSVSSKGGFLQFETIQGSCSAKMDNTSDKDKQIEGRNEQIAKQVIVSEAARTPFMDKMSSDGAVQLLANEEMKNGNPFGLSGLWDDSFTNISIGGLLSEVSLQGKFDSCDKKNGNNKASRPTLLISDSFDAFLAGRINQSQSPRASLLDTRSSIFDAEETCHGFPSQKFSSSGKEPISSGGSVGSTTSRTKDVDYKSFKFPKLTETNHSGRTKGRTCEESETDLILCSRVYNDESSLGLSGIKWTETLGPFDLGLSSSQKVSGDSIGIKNITALAS